MWCVLFDSSFVRYLRDLHPPLSPQPLRQLEPMRRESSRKNIHISCSSYVHWCVHKFPIVFNTPQQLWSPALTTHHHSGGYEYIDNYITSESCSSWCTSSWCRCCSTGYIWASNKDKWGTCTNAGTCHTKSTIQINWGGVKGKWYDSGNTIEYCRCCGWFQCACWQITNGTGYCCFWEYISCAIFYPWW